ncbi:MAG: hypothetical protein ACXV74_02440 [Methylobacter sp.]
MKQADTATTLFRLEQVLSGFPRASRPAESPTQPAPAADFLACAAPSKRTGPVFDVTLRRPLLVPMPPDYGPVASLGPSKDSPPADRAEIAGAIPKALNVYFGFDVTFDQTWNLKELSLGDLSSTISLAPNEQLTLEFQSSLRKVMEQSTLDSTEDVTSSESTVADKEAVNITRASSKTQSWHVDTTGTLTCGYASLSTTVGVSQSVTESNQQAVNHITDTTHKSAQSLKAMHKIEVRGVSESVVQNRMTRIIQNPYRDRTLSLNVFQLLKHFSIKTAIAETRFALVFRFNDLVFDSNFVSSHADFLRSTLIDSMLLDELPTAIQGARPPLPTIALNDAIETAQRALSTLYNYDNRYIDIFHVPTVDTGSGVRDANPPQSSFDATVDHSGLHDALSNHSAGFFVVLNHFWRVINEQVAGPPGGPPQILLIQSGDQAIRIATALAAQLRAQMQLLFPDPLKSDEFRNLLDTDDFTEIIRRVPGFLTMMDGMLAPLLEPAQVEKDALQAYQQAQYALQRLTAHLDSNRHFYIERFLRYVHQLTAGAATIDFAKDQAKKLGNLIPPGLFDGLDFDRTYIDKLEIVVPGFAVLENPDIGNILRLLMDNPDLPDPDDPMPGVIDELEAPADGIHLETAPGTCILTNIPPEDTENLDISLKDFEAHLKLSKRDAKG